MDLARAFSVYFRDEQWSEKAVIAALLTLVPIVGGLVVFGWALRYLRHVANAEDTRLPEWNAWTDDLVNGFKAGLVALVWLLPAFVVLLCGLLALVPTLSDRETLSTAGLIVFLASAFCLAPLLFALASFLLPLPLSRLSLTGRLADGLDFRSVATEARRALTDLLVAWLVGLGYSFVIAALLQFVYSIAFFLCIVGIAGALVLTGALQVHWTLVSVHLWGQIRYRLEHPGEPYRPQPVPA